MRTLLFSKRPQGPEASASLAALVLGRYDPDVPMPRPAPRDHRYIRDALTDGFLLRGPGGRAVAATWRQVCAELRIPMLETVVPARGRAGRLVVDLATAGRQWEAEERRVAVELFRPWVELRGRPQDRAPAWRSSGVEFRGLERDLLFSLADALVPLLGGPWSSG